MLRSFIGKDPAPLRFDREDLLSAGDGSLLGPQAPRLPTPPLLGFEEVHQVELTGGIHGKGMAVAGQNVAAFHWVFSCHFCDDPILPGSLMQDALLQLTGFYGGVLGFAGRGRAMKTGGVRFLKEVTPAAMRLEYRIDIRRAQPSSQIVIADGRVTVDGALCLEAEGLVVAIVKVSDAPASRIPLGDALTS